MGNIHVFTWILAHDTRKGSSQSPVQTRRQGLLTEAPAVISKCMWRHTKHPPSRGERSMALLKGALSTSNSAHAFGMTPSAPPACWALPLYRCRGRYRYRYLDGLSIPIPTLIIASIFFVFLLIRRSGTPIKSRGGFQ